MSSGTPTDDSRFLADILSNRYNRAILDEWHALALADGWLVAGCLFQTAWNVQTGRAPEAGIRDYDIFYFDPRDLSAAGEQAVQQRVDSVLGTLGVPIEVKNQARVHLWLPVSATCQCEGRHRPLPGSMHVRRRAPGRRSP